jgi:hypothetical protein
MAVNDIVMGAAGGSTDANYIESCFSTYLYTGNGSTQTITNGIDLSGKGGLVWSKGRNNPGYNHTLMSTAYSGMLFSDTTQGANDYPTDINSYNSNGFTLKASTNYANISGTTYASWTFRKQPKFFDVVTYTGTGSVLTVSHNLGAVPGCIIVKHTNALDNWAVYHRTIGNTGALQLNLTSATDTGSAYWNNTTPTSTEFTVGTNGRVNDSGGTYVAYLFAHNAGGFGTSGTDNVISCGSFTTDGGGAATVNLGYEPQWIMIKASSGVSNWTTIDNMRGFTATTGSSNNSARLFPNNANAEGVNDTASPNATGFTTTGLTGGLTYIYIAIRRPMKTPTTGTEVFSPVTYAGNNTVRTITAGFVTDFVIAASRTYVDSKSTYDRLRGANKIMFINQTNAEASLANQLTGFDSNIGYILGTDPYGYINYAPANYVNWAFRRAPGFFDVVCYTGTGANRTVNHNLTVAPEMMIVKSRSSSTFGWFVYHSSVGNTKYLQMDTNAAPVTNNEIWNNTSPTSTVFTIGTSAAVNAVNQTEVVYLFATCAGVSKVGSYTGNGSSQTINCGFTSGSRFIMIKRTDSTGDWYVWDTARGIVAGNDPHLSLNTTAAEVTTDDSIDAASSGFIVNQLAATNINVNAATYIFLAIA